LRHDEPPLQRRVPFAHAPGNIVAEGGELNHIRRAHPALMAIRRN